MNVFQFSNPFRSESFFLLSILLSMALTTLQAQPPAAPPGRTITVVGSASMEIQPDEVTLSVELFEDQGKSGKSSLEEMETKFFETLKKHGIANSQVQPFGGSNSWYYWWKERSKPLRMVRYQLKVNTKTDLLALVKSLHQMGVAELKITDKSAPDLEAKRKAVKIEAIKAAKEKARYLMEAIGGTIGRALMVEEVEYPYNMINSGSFNLSNVMMEGSETTNALESTGTITLRAEMRVVFEIGE